jgi:hypothetical protein
VGVLLGQAAQPYLPQSRAIRLFLFPEQAPDGRVQQLTAPEFAPPRWSLARIQSP